MTYDLVEDDYIFFTRKLYPPLLSHRNPISDKEAKKNDHSKYIIQNISNKIPQT
jgi:hypothetical protein